VKNCHIPNLGELHFISPTTLRDFDNIVSNIDFKGNDIFVSSIKEYLINLLEMSDDETTEWKIFLAALGDEVIGITGWYIFKDTPDISWLTWFGVINKYQRFRIGSLLLRHTIEAIKEDTTTNDLYVYCIDEVAPFYIKNKFKLLGRADELGLTSKCEDDSNKVLSLQCKKCSKVEEDI
jgi:GNAT superfamily N-acetyltransferase